MVKLGPWVPWMPAMDHRNCPGAVSPQRAAWRPFDPRMTAPVEELRSGDPGAARWWDDHTVRDYASVAKQIRTPPAGMLPLIPSWEAQPVAP